MLKMKIFIYDISKQWKYTNRVAIYYNYLKNDSKLSERKNF